MEAIIIFCLVLILLAALDNRPNAATPAIMMVPVLPQADPRNGSGLAGLALFLLLVAIVGLLLQH